MKTSSQSFQSGTASSAYLTATTADDPYRYQVGFGNRFASEALDGVLPQGRNTPQRVQYDLYSEQINGTAFVCAREQMANVWLYRIKPAVAHSRLRPLPVNKDLEANFSTCNPRVSVVAAESTWLPLPVSEKSTSLDFVSGLKTIAGNGDSMQNEGLAVHVYTANTSMGNKAFASQDGDFLLLPQQGRLDIQTELGRIMVRPGELCVIQRGIRFKVSLPDGPVRGYVQELFGAHYELPELGVLGANGLALERDFESPVASFDVDDTNEWQVIYKLCGQLFAATQNHTPFDVVAWHGNYCPYKYAMEKFVNLGTVEKEQVDPTVYCILTAKSKIPGKSLTDFCAFTPRWCTSTNTFRPPYYHRNMSSEILGVIYGKNFHDLAPGSLQFTNGFMPHGETYETFLAATEGDLEPVLVGEATIGFMLHVGVQMTITDFALNRSGVLGETEETKWDTMEAGFMRHLPQIARSTAHLTFEAAINGTKGMSNGFGHVSKLASEL